MKSQSRYCPSCASGRTKRNGVRARAQVQQYLCRNCRHQWTESRDPLVAMLSGLGIDARKHGILKAVALFVRGKTMSSIEKKTGIKSETLKKYLELLRKLDLGEHLDSLLKEKARLSRSYLEDLHTFWVECEMTRNPYRVRGQWQNRVSEEDKPKCEPKGAVTAGKPLVAART